jgi:hypothetical protein
MDSAALDYDRIIFTFDEGGDDVIVQFVLDPSEVPGDDFSLPKGDYTEIVVASIWLRKVHLYLRRGFEKPNVALEEDGGGFRHLVLHKRHPGL